MLSRLADAKIYSWIIGIWLKHCWALTHDFRPITASPSCCALVWICMPVIDGLLFGNSNWPGVHKGSILANHRPWPNSAPVQCSLNRKPAPDANPGGRWVFSMQHSALTRTRPFLLRSLPAQWSFSGPEGRGGAGIGGGGACGRMNQVGCRSLVLINQKHPESP